MATAAKDAKEYFDVQIPDALRNHPDKAREVNAIYCFKITGDGGGDWTVDLASDPPTCTEGANGDAQCTVEVSADDFKTMLTDQQAGMQLYFQGRLKIEGDLELAAGLKEVFGLVGKVAAAS